MDGTDDMGNDGAESNDDSMDMIYDDDEKGNTTLATASTKRETLLPSTTLAPFLQNGTQKVVNLNMKGGGKKEPLKLKEPASELKPQKQNVPMLAVVGRSTNNTNNNSSDGNIVAKRRNCNSEAMHRLILEVIWHFHMGMQMEILPLEHGLEAIRCKKANPVKSRR